MIQMKFPRAQGSLGVERQGARGTQCTRLCPGTFSTARADGQRASEGHTFGVGADEDPDATAGWHEVKAGR